MNIIDIIIVACFAIAIIWGFKDGLIRQLGTLVGIILGIVLANSLGSTVGQLLGIEGSSAAAWGFAIVFIVCLIATALISKIVRKVVSAVGLGILDRVGGAALGAIRCALVLVIILSLIDFGYEAFGGNESSAFSTSKLSDTVISLGQYIMPTIDWAKDQIPVI
ncbi:MAG: CvpA family protein [Rikenellaceae bacterium]